jgi:hypothetical protein
MKNHKDQTIAAALHLLCDDYTGIRFGPRVDVLYEALCGRFFKPKPEVLALRIVRELELRKHVV